MESIDTHQNYLNLYEGMQDKERDIYLKIEFIITEQYTEQSQNTLELLASDTIII